MKQFVGAVAVDPRQLQQVEGGLAQTLRCAPAIQNDVADAGPAEELVAPRARVGAGILEAAAVLRSR